MAIPDENLYPTATGNAAETVAEHQAKQDLVFYSGWVSFSTPSYHDVERSHANVRLIQFCPFNQRVWISLEEKGIPYQYKEVNPYRKEKHFLGTWSTLMPNVRSSHEHRYQPQGPRPRNRVPGQGSLRVAHPVRVP